MRRMEYVDHMAQHRQPKLDYGLYASVGPAGVYDYGSAAGSYDPFGAAQGVGKFGRQDQGGGNRFAPYEGGQSAASKGGGKPGDWTCPSCQNYNYASRSNCNRCHIPKPADEGAPGTGGSQEQSTAASSGRGGGKFNPRPDDWPCPACKNNNYASRSICNRCQFPKPLDFKNPLELGGLPNYMPNPMMGYGQMGGMGMMGGMAMPRFPGLGPPTGPPVPAHGTGMRPGDWVCRACNNHNYSSREVCNKCKIGKDVYVAKSGMKEGDWICPGCSNHNFKDKVNCNKCRLPKPSLDQSAHDASQYVPQ
jgi:hypothetical protein